MGSVILGNMFGAFFSSIFSFLAFTMLFPFLIISLIINPISTIIYSLFYRTELSYEQRYALINYNLNKLYLFKYIGITVISLLVYKIIEKELNTLSILIINLIEILIYLPIYLKAKRIIIENNIEKHSDSMKNKLHKFKFLACNWESESKEVLENFQKIKNSTIELEKKIIKINNIENIINLQKKEFIKIYCYKLEDVFFLINLIYGKYEENWSIVDIRINKDKLFIKILLKNKIEKFFIFQRIN